MVSALLFSINIIVYISKDTGIFKYNGFLYSSFFFHLLRMTDVLWSYDIMKNETTGNRVNFTKKVIDSLPLPEKGYKQYYDTGTPGLILRMHHSGVKSFYLFRRIDRRVEYISLGRYPAVFPEQARRRAAELNAEICAGKNPA